MNRTDILQLQEHADFIPARVLDAGDCAAVCSLRRLVGDQGLVTWFEKHHGGGLSASKIRFWDLLLELPSNSVSNLLAKENRMVWAMRVAA